MKPIYSLHEPLPLEETLAKFPTLAAGNGSPRTTDKYRVISTADMLRRLDGDGYRLHGVSVARTKIAENIGFERHMVRLRHIAARGFNAAGAEAPEIVGINSHNGDGAWLFFAGVIRFACSNGLVIGTAYGHASCSHRGAPDLVAKRVLEGIANVSTQFGRIGQVIDAWKGVNLTPDTRRDFAEKAFDLRFERGEPANDGSPTWKAPVSPYLMLDARRASDAGNDLWSTFNVLQENIVQGGQLGSIMGGNGRPRRQRVRQIGSITKGVQINRQLFDLAASYADAA